MDTSVALPATLSPRGMTRKFWLLLAVGALAYRAEHLRLELHALNEEAKREGGGEIRGAELLEGLARAAEQRLTALHDHLPEDFPGDWVSLGSAVLFDEYERKVREVGAKLNPRVSPEMAPLLRRQFEVICVGGPAPFDAATAPAPTRDPADDAIVYTALLADADFLISDDRDIVPDGDERHLRARRTPCTGGPLRAFRARVLQAGGAGLGSRRRDEARYGVPPPRHRRLKSSRLSRYSAANCGSAEPSRRTQARPARASGRRCAIAPQSQLGGAAVRGHRGGLAARHLRAH